MPDPHKEPLALSEEDLDRLRGDVSLTVDVLAARYPDVRPIDILNAFLQVFTDRARAESSDV